jgi:predicted enzyme related to lactoylglutathione lyase
VLPEINDILALMSNAQKHQIGEIVWRDLTVQDAEQARKFYCDVVGWTSTPQEMGNYADFNIHAPATDECIAGICHARGTNTNVPAQWLMYINVADVDASAARCIQLGGKVIDGPRAMGAMRFCVIQDPAGAVAALVSQT